MSAQSYVDDRAWAAAVRVMAVGESVEVYGHDAAMCLQASAARLGFQTYRKQQEVRASVDDSVKTYRVWKVGEPGDSDETIKARRVLLNQYGSLNPNDSLLETIRELEDRLRRASGLIGEIVKYHRAGMKYALAGAIADASDFHESGDTK